MYPFDIFLIILAIAFPTAGIAFLIVYIKDKYEKSRNKQNFFNPFRFKALLIVILIAAISLITVNLFFTEPEFSDPLEKIRYGKKREIPEMVKDGYEELMTGNITNIDLHYHYIKWHFKQAVQKKAGKNIILRNDNEIFRFYNYLKLNENDTITAIGNIGYSYCLFRSGRYSKAISYLKSYPDVNVRYRNYIIGNSYAALGSYKLAEKYYLMETQTRNGYFEGSIERLVYSYLKDRALEKAILFFENKDFRKYIAIRDLKDISLLNNDVKGFFKYFFLMIKSSTDIVGLIAALLICFTWLYYLRRIDIYKPEKLYLIISVLIAGMLLSPLSNICTIIIKYYIEAGVNGNPLNDMLYMILGVGAVEEFVKIIPLLFLLLFTRIVKEPYDYLFYACVSALGFSFIENLAYFETGSLHIMHGRALISVIGHMFNSSVIAYGMVLARFQWKSRMLPAFFAYFVLASVVHGVYNFMLIYNFQLLFILYYFCCIRIWVIFLNNTLNNSSRFDYKIKLDASRVQFYLVTTLTSILVFEYIALGWIYGPLAANTTLLSTSSMGSILILFLSTRLSKIDLVRKHWRIIDFRLNPFVVKRHPLNFVGLRITLKSFYMSSNLGSILTVPVAGTITDRIIMYNDHLFSFKKRKTESNWFLVRLDKPLKIKGSVKDHVLLKFRSRQAKLTEETDIPAKILAINNMDSLDMEKIQRSSFSLLGGVLVNYLTD